MADRLVKFDFCLVFEKSNCLSGMPFRGGAAGYLNNFCFHTSTYFTTGITGVDTLFDFKDIIQSILSISFGNI